APHAAEELWQVLGHDRTLAHEPWPSYDPALLQDEEVEVPVQVNGKLRGRVTVPAGADQAAIEAAARADERIAAMLEGKTVRSAGRRTTWSTSNGRPRPRSGRTSRTCRPGRGRRRGGGRRGT